MKLQPRWAHLIPSPTLFTPDQSAGDNRRGDLFVEGEEGVEATGMNRHSLDTLSRVVS